MGDYSRGGEMKKQPLSVILDEIEGSAMFHDFNELLESNAALVRALRRQLAFIESTAGVLSPSSVELLKKEIITILT